MQAALILAATVLVGGLAVAAGIGLLLRRNKRHVDLDQRLLSEAGEWTKRP